MDFASLVRVFEPNPNDEFVDKRVRAVGQIKERLKGKTLSVSLANANGIAQGFLTGIVPDPLASEVETAIKAQSSSFVRSDQELQVLVCALGAAQQLVEELKPIERGAPELFVAAVLAALAQLRPHSNDKVEALRQTLVMSAREFLDGNADAARTRISVPPFETTPASSEESVETYAAKLKKGVDRTISALISNAALDREELDLMWWTLADWSETLNHRISELPEGAAVFVSALEVVQRLKKLPATAHAYIATRHVKVQQLSVADFRRTLGDHKAILWEHVGLREKRTPYPHVFSLLEGLDGAQEVRKAPELTLHWCRDLSLEIFLMLKLSGRIA